MRGRISRLIGSLILGCHKVARNGVFGFTSENVAAGRADTITPLLSAAQAVLLHESGEAVPTDRSARLDKRSEFLVTAPPPAAERRRTHVASSSFPASTSAKIAARIDGERLAHARTTLATSSLAGTAGSGELCGTPILDFRASSWSADSFRFSLGGFDPPRAPVSDVGPGGVGGIGAWGCHIATTLATAATQPRRKSATSSWVRSGR